MTYQWASSSDGNTYTAVPGATSASLVISDASLSQSGIQYRVTVSNSAAIASSSAARLTVTAAVVTPAISVQPANQNVFVGDNATFSITATGTTLAYEWQSSTDNGVSFVPITGATAPSVVVTAANSTQSGSKYRVQISNGAGAVFSTAAVLTVSVRPAAPMITVQPLPQAIVAGQAAVFSTAVTGNPNPSLQWRLNGVALADGAVSAPCGGATATGTASNSLSLSAVPLSCNGVVLSVVVSNGVGADAISAAAALTVNPAPAAPVVLSQPISAIVRAPASATFTVAAAGVPTPTVQWQQSTDNGANFANIVGATTASYTTPSTGTGDSGLFLRAVLVNATGTVTSSVATLTVSSPATNIRLLAGSIGGAGTLDGPSASARFAYPNGVAVDAAGIAYVADTFSHTIRKVLLDGSVSTLAGQAGLAGSADGPGAGALFRSPVGIAVDTGGNVYVTGDYAIRKITPAGMVSTLAGLAGVPGTVGGTGSVARFQSSSGIAIDASGTLFVLDGGVRRVTSSGAVDTLVSNLPASPQYIALDSSGNCYITSDQGVISKVTPAGVVTTLAGANAISADVDGPVNVARFNWPFGIAVDSSGNVFIADNHGDSIRKLTPGGIVSTIAGFDNGSHFGGSSDGTGALAHFYGPTGLALTPSGDLIVADSENRTLRRVSVSGVVTTFAGLAAVKGADDGIGAAARFDAVRGVVGDSIGNVYVADSQNNSVRTISAAGVVTTLLHGSGLSTPFGLALDPGGPLVVANFFNDTVDRISSAGVLSPFAGLAGYLGFNDGTGTAARFNTPAGIARDSLGNFFVTDYYGHNVRKITAAGVVTRIAGGFSSGSQNGVGTAASFNQPAGVGVDSAGNVYVADSANHTIRKITPAGIVSTFAGRVGVAGYADGSASGSLFSTPIGIAVDAMDNVYVADYLNSLVRVITPSGLVSTVVGRIGETGIRVGGDGRLSNPTAIALLAPKRLAISTANGILVADLP